MLCEAQTVLYVFSVLRETRVAALLFVEDFFAFFDCGAFGLMLFFAAIWIHPLYDV